MRKKTQNDSPQLNVILKPSADVELITPKIAEKLLKRNKSNRPLREMDVDNYADEINNDHWFVTNNGIGICEDGTLMDGQHRLNAIIKSGIAQEITVVRNIKAEAASIIDTGRKRRLEDFLAMGGYQNYSVLSGAARLIYALNNGHKSLSQGTVRVSTKTTIHKILEFIKSEANLVKNVDYALRNYKGLIKNSTHPIVTGIFHIAYSRDPELAIEMFNALETGAIGDPYSVLLQCRNMLIEHKQRQIKMRSTDPGYAMYLIVRTWNALRDGIHDERLMQDYSLPIPVIK